MQVGEHTTSKREQTWDLKCKAMYFDAVDAEPVEDD
jgi:hypothetical protein